MASISCRRKAKNIDLSSLRVTSFAFEYNRVVYLWCRRNCRMEENVREDSCSDRQRRKIHLRVPSSQPLTHRHLRPVLHHIDKIKVNNDYTPTLIGFEQCYWVMHADGRSNSHGMAVIHLTLANPVSQTVIFLTRMLYKNINRFDDIC